jgi:hypothetical protein
VVPKTVAASRYSKSFAQGSLKTRPEPNCVPDDAIEETGSCKRLQLVAEIISLDRRGIRAKVARLQSLKTAPAVPPCERLGNRNDNEKSR